MESIACIKQSATYRPFCASIFRPKTWHNSLQSSSITVSPYQGSNSWSYTYSDNKYGNYSRNQGKCYSFNVTTNTSNPVTRMVSTNTQMVQKTTSGAELKENPLVSLVVNGQDCLPSLAEIKAELLAVLNDNKPSCVTTSKSWSISISKDGSPSANGSIAGIDEATWV